MPKSLNVKSDLLNQYNHFKLKAHSSFMHGIKEEASEFYELAFDTNKLILKHCSLDNTSIERTLNACLDCLDFCICTDSSKLAYFLHETSKIFGKILEANYDDEKKCTALISYSQIVHLYQELACYSSYEQSNKLVSTFNNLCFKNNHLLSSL